MNIYESLLMIGIIPVIASVLIAYALKWEKMKTLSYKKKQIIIGLIFGVIAICGTEFGVHYEGTVINVRDAAPLCAGLIFGAPAGIIAGVIGGIERWISVYWSYAYFTRLECTVATILTGLIAAGLKKYMFEDKVPFWGHAFAIGVIAEVIHMLMIFLTNTRNVKIAFEYIQACTVPMVLVNAAAAAAAVYAVSLVNRKEKPDVKTEPTISNLFQKRLIIAVLAGYTLTTAFNYIIQSNISEDDLESLFMRNLTDVVSDVVEQSDLTFLQTGRYIADEIASEQEPDLQKLKTRFAVYEINIVNKSGVITDSTNKNNIGMNISKQNPEVKEYQELLTDSGIEAYVQDLVPTTDDPDVYLKFTSVRTETGFVQIAFEGDQVSAAMNDLLPGVVANRHIGETGGLIILDDNYKYVYATLWLLDQNGVKDLNLNLSGIESYELNRCTLNNTPYYYMYTTMENYNVAAVLPVSEADFSRKMSIYLNFFMLTLIFASLFLLIYFIIKYLIAGNLQKVNASLARITDGDLDTVVNVRSAKEFIDLSDDINETVDTLKRYIAEANTRIDTELRYAREIQSSALPSIFPNRPEIDLYALTDPAREVGGDFYDFYFIGRNKLVFLVADVSGKGIPASLFMMRAKTLMKTFAENRISMADIFTNANYQLCEGNETSMFVTSWMGILNLETGELKYANAGHNRPLIRRKDGVFKYLEDKPGFVLAGLEGIAYKEHTLMLEPGDEIFLYTDGVVEASNRDEELYGDDRLRDFVNEHIGEDAKTLCESVKNDVDRFYEGVPQFDDITELSLKFFRFAPPHH